jgi:TRAP-type C4-dicarboxylate transport system substrate-binding protein
MKKRQLLAHIIAAAALCCAAAPALAQTKLKWAHIYETSHAYHKWAVWAADEVKKRTGGR